MARIICFTDDTQVASAVQQSLQGCDHELRFLSSSRLSDDIRETIRQLDPDMLLLELTAAIDNPHLLIFLRSDQHLRETPLLLLSGSVRHRQQADILGANGFVLRPRLREQLLPAIDAHVPRARVYAAA